MITSFSSGGGIRLPECVCPLYALWSMLEQLWLGGHSQFNSHGPCSFPDPVTFLFSDLSLPALGFSGQKLGFFLCDLVLFLVDNIGCSLKLLVSSDLFAIWSYILAFCPSLTPMEFSLHSTDTWSCKSPHVSVSLCSLFLSFGSASILLMVLKGLRYLTALCCLKIGVSFSDRHLMQSKRYAWWSYFVFVFSCSFSFFFSSSLNNPFLRVPAWILRLVGMFVPGALTDITTPEKASDGGKPRKSENKKVSSQLE